MKLEELKIGTRVKYSEEWLSQNSERLRGGPDRGEPLKDRLGTVVNSRKLALYENCVNVRWDNTKSNVSYHVDFLEEVQEVTIG